MEDQLHRTPEHPLNARFGPQPSPPGSGKGQLGTMDTRQAIAIALIVLGMIGVVVAWFGISGTLDPGEQMPYLASGGIGGAALIAIGVMMYVSWEHVQDRAALATLLQRLEAVEVALRDVATVGPDPTAETPRPGAANGSSRPRAPRARSTRASQS
jgi:hypothetical protein